MKAIDFKFVIGVAVSLMLIAIGTLLLLTPKQTFAGSPAVSPAFSVATTSTTISITTSTRILATTTSVIAPSYTRAYANICNTSASKAIVISMNGDKPANASTSGGVWINANSCYEITDKMLYQGSVTASSSDQSSVQVLVNDYTY